jgi:hypothetical protein
MSEMDFIRPLAPIGVIFAVLCYSRRKKEVGGWLMFFYYQIFASIALFLLQGTLRSREYLPSWWESEWDYIIFLGAVLPRLFAFILVGAISTLLLYHRDWLWVRNLKVALFAAIVLLALSLLVDLAYFPSAIFTNCLRLIMLVAWLIYFSVSKRVHHVFRTHDWDKFGNQIATDS